MHSINLHLENNINNRRKVTYLCTFFNMEYNFTVSSFFFQFCSKRNLIFNVFGPMEKSTQLAIEIFKIKARWGEGEHLMLSISWAYNTRMMKTKLYQHLAARVHVVRRNPFLKENVYWEDMQWKMMELFVRQNAIETWKSIIQQTVFQFGGLIVGNFSLWSW